MPLDSTGCLSPTSYGERDILFHRPTVTEQEQANSTQSVRARRAVDEDGEVRAICAKAADIIEGSGWYRLGPCPLNTGNQARCLVDAISEATGIWELPPQVLKRLGFAERREATNWNDEPSRTKAEVIARLRSAAEQRA